MNFGKIMSRASVVSIVIALCAVLAIPETSFRPRETAETPTPESLRQMLWPSRIESGPSEMPRTAIFHSGTGGADVIVQSNRFRLSASQHWISFRDARPGVEPEFESPLNRIAFFSADASSAKRFARYSRVRFGEVYPGIDFVFHVAASAEPQFDFEVAAGADPRNIVIDLPRGATVSLRDGAAHIRQGEREMRLAAPVAWQETPRGRQMIDVAFERDGRSLSFHLGKYDARLPLVIDPLVAADSTFLGSNANEDTIQAMTLDEQGNIYLAGVTQFTPGVSGTFPTTTGSYVKARGTSAPWSTNCMFVLKLSPNYQVQYGALISSTTPTGIAVSQAGEAVVVGRTLLGNDFPWTPGVFASDSTGQGFVLKLTPDGSALTYAASFRASQANAVALRADGVAIVAGTANLPGLPTTPSALKPAYQPNGDTINEDGFVLVVSDDGTQLLAGTYLGGLLNDSATAVTVDSQSRVTVAGSFRSIDMTGMPGSPAGLGDVYLVRLSADLSSVLGQRLFGGAGSDVVNALVVDPQGGWLAGGSTTSADLPVTASAYQRTRRGSQPGWLARLDGNLAFRYLTYFGGDFQDGVAALTTDPVGNAYFASTTFSVDMPTTADGFQDVTSLGLREGHFGVLNPEGTQLIYGTYLGGEKTTPRHFDALTGAWAVARSSSGNVYVAGSTAAASFPVTGSSLRTGMGGIADAFLVRFEDQALRISSPSLLQQARTNVAYSVQLNATGGRAPYTWSLAGFQLPDGLTLNASGLISGTANNNQAETDEYQFTVVVRDADGRVAHKSVFIGVVYPGNWYCATTNSCSISLVPNQQLIYSLPALRDGTPPFTYVVGGTLPPGITVSSSGALTGSATAAGIYNATVNISDAAGQQASLALRFDVTDPNAPPPPSGGGGSGGGSSSSSGGGGGGGGGAFGVELLVLVLLTTLSLSGRRRRVHPGALH